MIGETIKWRIKIVNLVNNIFIGIGLKTILENNEYLLQSGQYDKHGCYIVAQNGYLHTYMDK